MWQQLRGIHNLTINFLSSYSKIFPTFNYLKNNELNSRWINFFFIRTMLTTYFVTVTISFSFHNTTRKFLLSFYRSIQRILRILVKASYVHEKSAVRMQKCRSVFLVSQEKT